MKELLRKIANKLGYDFIKINVHSADKATKTFPVKIGRFEISMPGNNPQVSLYKYSPASNEQLGKLARIVERKYPGCSVIDVGANVGDTIAVIRNQTEVPIIAIEGDDFSYSFLKKNATQFQNIKLFQQYLGEKKEHLNVNIEKDGWNNTIIPNDSGSKKLEIKTLDELLSENNLQGINIKLLKVDTEGFDTIILRGALQTIQKHKPVLYFEYNGENMRAINENGLNTLVGFKQMGYENIHVYDCIDNQIMVTTLDNFDALQQLHNYAHRKRSMIPYFDICIFHKDDGDISGEFRDL